MNPKKNSFVIGTYLMLILLLTGVGGSSFAAEADGVSLDGGSSTLTTPAKQGQEKTLSTTEVKSTTKSVFEAFKNGNMRTAVAGMLTLIIWVWRKYFSLFFIDKLTDFGIGILVAFISLLATIPEALAATPFNLGSFLISSFVSSSEAMFFWQVVLKNIPGFGIVTPKPKTGV